MDNNNPPKERINPGDRLREWWANASEEDKRLVRQRAANKARGRKKSLRTRANMSEARRLLAIKLGKEGMRRMCWDTIPEDKQRQIIDAMTAGRIAKAKAKG